MLSLPFPELPLTFFAFVVGENVGEDAPGDVFDFVLRNTGIVDELFPAAQAGCSLRFNVKNAYRLNAASHNILRKSDLLDR